MNSCIALLGQIDGQAVRTVEGLHGPAGGPHAVQVAMAESDATQCGFCTPGFVMSAYAFAPGGEKAELDTIHDALAGNLCRCTGYRPIVEAMTKVAGLAVEPAPKLRHAPVRRASMAASMRRARSPIFWPCAPSSPRRCCWRAPPISASWPAGRASRRPPSSMSRTCPSSTASETGKQGGDRRRGELCAGHASADRQLSCAEDLSRAAGLAADPHHGHAGRQYRHGLADRRHAAGADRAGGPAGSPRRAARVRCRWRISSSTIARRSPPMRSLKASPCRSCGQGKCSLRQALQAPRPGYLDRRGRLSPEDQDRPRTKTRASPSAAWPRRPSAR